MTFADRLDPLLRRRSDVKLHVHYQALWLIFRERGIGAMGDEAPGHSGCQAASPANSANEWTQSVGNTPAGASQEARSARQPHDFP